MTDPATNVHDYLSTACYHELHARCRQSCKFCAIVCRCECHKGTTEKVNATNAPKIASYNGHMHADCTNRCVSRME